MLSPSLRSRVNSAKDLGDAQREILRFAQDDMAEWLHRRELQHFLASVNAYGVAPTSLPPSACAAKRRKRFIMLCGKMREAHFST